MPSLMVSLPPSRAHAHSLKALAPAAASRCPTLPCGAPRAQYDALFYMIRMLRSPLPRTMAWLPATIHEHIVCQARGWA